MVNFREVNDDILKEWLLYREDEISSLTNKAIVSRIVGGCKKHSVQF